MNNVSKSKKLFLIISQKLQKCYVGAKFQSELRKGSHFMVNFIEISEGRLITDKCGCERNKSQIVALKRGS